MNGVMAACGLTFLIAAPTLPAQEQPSDSALIHETSRRFSEAYVRGDADAMTVLYTSDATIFPERSSALSGLEAIRKYWTLPPGRRVSHDAATPMRIVVDGDHAYDHGVFEISGERDGKAWGPVQGKYVIVWRREPRGWRMQLDIWNSGPEPRS
jgi:ketosteroid isomerase-like protein